MELRTPSTKPGSRDAQEIVAASQKITVAVVLTMSDATGSCRVTRNKLARRSHPQLMTALKLMTALRGFSAGT